MGTELLREWQSANIGHGQSGYCCCLEALGVQLLLELLASASPVGASEAASGAPPSRGHNHAGRDSQVADKPSETQHSHHGGAKEVC